MQYTQKMRTQKIGRNFSLVLICLVFLFPYLPRAQRNNENPIGLTNLLIVSCSTASYNFTNVFANIISPSIHVTQLGNICLFNNSKRKAISMIEIVVSHLRELPVQQSIVLFVHNLETVVFNVNSVVQGQ